MNTDSVTPAGLTDPPPASRRKRNLVLLALLIALAGLAWAAYWYSHARWFESTQDAYVAGNIVQVNSEVAGTVRAMHAGETDAVAEGQLLIELDPADAMLRMDAASAELANVVRQVQATFARADQLRAEIAAREAELRRGRQDFRRRESLAGGGAVSEEELNHARESLDALSAAERATREGLRGALAQTQGTTPGEHPLVRRAAANLRDAALALRRTQITAPVAGVIARKSAQLGQRVAPGAPLLAIVPLDDLWVEANFKEVQLDGMRIGQPVSLRSDLYGGSVVYQGRVKGFSAGTGAAFALLPAQNASGNWIKIIQRVPVRVELDPEEVKAHPLRVGLSMRAEVDLHDRSGPMLAVPSGEAAAPQIERGDTDPATEALIARIIDENSVTTPGSE